MVGGREVSSLLLFFFFNDTATTEIYTLSLHDALPICRQRISDYTGASAQYTQLDLAPALDLQHSAALVRGCLAILADRKSTRLNSSHANISYAVFCLKKKNNICTTFHNTTHYS